MPPSTNPKEVKQFLGLVGYHHKFIPCFSDISRPLNILNQKDVSFDGTKQCQEAFPFLKDNLMKEPISKYPDPKKPSLLFTDASKYAQCICSHTIL